MVKRVRDLLQSNNEMNKKPIRNKPLGRFSSFFWHIKREGDVEITEHGGIIKKTHYK
jgi:hypothetical protein